MTNNSIYRVRMSYDSSSALASIISQRRLLCLTASGLIAHIPGPIGHVLQSCTGPPCSEVPSSTIGGTGFLSKPDMKGPELVLTADGRGL